jgi:outer membrane protein OmpA-like peptidoglycan-associated protein
MVHLPARVRWLWPAARCGGRRRRFDPWLGLLLAVAPVPAARAQVTVDLRALDALPQRPPAAAPHARVAPARPAKPFAPQPAPRVATVPSPAAPPASAPAAVPARAQASVPAASPAGAPAGQAPAVTATPPVARAAPAASTALPAAPPASPAGAPALSAAPPPPATLAGIPAPGAPAVPKPAAAPPKLVLPFAPGRAELTPAETAAVARLAHAVPANEAASFSVLAYAPGSPQNPSAARRLALARALAVHDALRAAGVPSSRIFLRAVGPPTGSGAPDRAELRVSVVAGTNP